MAYIYLHSGDFRANVGTYIPYMEDMGSDFKSLYLLYVQDWRFREMGVPPIAGWFIRDNPSIDG